MDGYLCVEQAAEACVVEKKSKFIAQLMPVSSEEEAMSFIESVNKKHYAARHNCYAYSVGGDMPVTRYSDDGEPQGTAGKPIMEVINTSGIHNVCIVVTRYFGGTLLGTGGLVRAYTAAAKGAVDNCTTKLLKHMLKVCITVTYSELSGLQYILNKESAVITGQEYSENVRLDVNLPYTEAQRTLDRITELTCGGALIERGDDIYA